MFASIGVGQLVQQPAAVGGVHLRPRARLERLAGGLDGQVDVGLVPLGDPADDLAGGGVERLERLAGLAIDPLAADEQRLVLDLGRLAGFGLAVVRWRWPCVCLRGEDELVRTG